MIGNNANRENFFMVNPYPSNDMLSAYMLVAKNHHSPRAVTGRREQTGKPL
jgi:hypothetical protein